MNDVVLVTVVDALEDLLHEDSSITLREFTSLEDLIEEFSTLANSIKKINIRNHLDNC